MRSVGQCIVGNCETGVLAPTLLALFLALEDKIPEYREARRCRCFAHMLHWSSRRSALSELVQNQRIPLVAGRLIVRPPRALLRSGVASDSLSLKTLPLRVDGGHGALAQHAHALANWC